jgi:predicted permease
MTRALRRCVRDPLTSALAVVIVALGTGATTTLFSILHAVAIAPLPFPDSRQLVVVLDRDRFDERVGVTPGRYRDYSTRLRPTIALAALRPGLAFNAIDHTGAFRATGAIADRGLFGVLGRQPQLGRIFDDRDFDPDAAPVVIISYSIWKDHFLGAAGVVGRPLILDGIPHEIVGVLPPDWMTPAGETDVWLPLRLTVWNRVSRNLTLIGRLGPGVTIARADATLAAAHAALAADYPATDGAVRPVLDDLASSLGGAARTPLALVFAGSLGLMCLVGFNLATLLLARTAARRQEIAIYRALGASAVDVTALQIAEGVLLVGSGATAGLVLARFAIPLVSSMTAAASHSPLVMADIELSMPAFAAAAVSALVILLLASWAPVALSARISPFETLRTRASPLEQRTRRGLVVVEVAAAVTLLLTAAALTRSVIALLRVDPGFAAERVLTARVTLPATSHGSAEIRRKIAERLQTELESIAGVERAAIGSALPFRAESSPFNFFTDATATERHQAEHRSIGPGYAETLGLRLLAGRTFTSADGQESPRVALVTASLTSLWGVDTPAAVVGRRLSIDGPGGPWREIVGVVADTRHSALTQAGRGELYLPWTQDPWPAMAVVVRFAPGVPPSASRVQQALASIDPRLPLFDVAMLSDRLRASLGSQLLLQRGFAAFAGLAALLALAGVFALLTWNVASRQHELALRLAMGATPLSVARSSSLQTAALLIIGMVTGAPAAWLISRVVAAIVPGCAPLDLGTTVFTLAVFTGAAVLVSIEPGRRAAATDPCILIRS